MFRVYFDGIEQNEKDIININDVAQFSIIREDGFSSDEQILRDKTEMDLQFCGGAYSYICNKIATDRCNEIEFRIEDDETGLFYNGVIPVTLCELDLSKNIGKTKIKDNSFSAFIRDYLDVDVFLGATKTIGCNELPLSRKDFIFNKVHNTNLQADEITIFAFDVLDVFNQMIGYFTNNEMYVVSNYLTSNKYAITTGFNMHNFAFSERDLYPELTMQDLFAELRKKLNIFIGIEYDVANRPYLRIEQLPYFFSNTIPLFNINEIPQGAIQTYDIERDFNLISIGSNTFETEDPANEFYNENRQDGWIDSKYTSCGTCTGRKDNNLDLVSDYIISSNVIYEAINAGGVDYTNDDAIFLFNYEVSGVSNVVKRDLIDTEYVYNISLINSSVLQNFINYFANCIAVSRYPANGFLIQKTEKLISKILGTPIEFDVIVYDDSIVTDYYSGTPSYNLPPNIMFPVTGVPSSDPIRYFKSPVTGDYNLRAAVNKIFSNGTVTTADAQIQIIIYTDDTFTTISTYFEKTITSTDGFFTPQSLEIETGVITINAGECAIVALYLTTTPIGMLLYGYIASEISFEMLTDGNCVSINENNQDSKPFVLDFEYPLCFSDYQTAKENKNGYIDITGKRYWIRELTYRHNRLSNLKLMGNYSLCGC